MQGRKQPERPRKVNSPKTPDQPSATSTAIDQSADQAKTSSTPSSAPQKSGQSGVIALVKCPKLGNQPLYAGSRHGPGIAIGNWARAKNGYRCVKCGEIHPALKPL